MFDADKPVQMASQDRLGRTTFAQYLARCILDHSEPESFAVGLYGGWGTGKTSIINLVVEELNAAANNLLDSEKPIILNFSPWSYSGQGQLIYAFFRRLSSVIQQSPYINSKEKNKIVELLELYISFFTKKSWGEKLSPFFLKQKNNAYGWESGRDLTLVKAELNSLLLKQKNKIIIIIDNISRIEGGEIKQIFQIVKSMGDYNNTVYLLSLDKKHIINALGEEGEEYLEKIIQLPFEIPAISKQDLENIFLDRLKNIVETIPEESWSREHWADVYYSSLRFFFRNFRDITHYINMISFSFPRIKNLVNPIDFFALTAIEIFEPSVFAGIRDNKDLFTDLIEDVYKKNKKEDVSTDKLRWEEILQRAQYLPKELLKKLIFKLFPNLNQLYKNNFHQASPDLFARQNKRIFISDIFDVFFRLSIPTGYIPENEVVAFLSCTKNKEEFSQALVRLNQNNRIMKFLDLLDGNISNKISEESISHVVSALFDNGDLFPEEEKTLLTFDTQEKIHRICHQLLTRIELEDERFSIYLNSIKNSIYSIYTFIYGLNESSKEYSFFSVDHLNALKKVGVDKIKYWAYLGRLIEHPKLLYILIAWRNWSDDNSASDYVSEIIKNDRNLISFLCATLKNPIDDTISKQEKNSLWAESLKNIELFIIPKNIIPYAKKIFESADFENLREREQLSILIFFDLVNISVSKNIPKTSS